MVDIRKLREDPELFKRGAEKKGFDADIDEILRLDEERRSLQSSIDTRKKELGQKSKQLKGASGTSVAESTESTESTEGGTRGLETLQAELKSFSRTIKDDEQRLRSIEEKRNKLLLRVPNPPMEDVPVGKDEADNVEIKRMGDIPSFTFKPKDHVELGHEHNLIDIERGARVAGSRCYYLKGDAALLENALMRYALDFLSRRGFTPMITPMFVREQCMVGSGYFPVGREETYSIEKDGLFLIGTSEVTLVSYHMGELLNEDDLPIRYAGYTTCFRREAGSYGKDVRGLYRVHQFQKVEQVVICRNNQEEMNLLHREILKNSEEIVANLELPYRVVEVCTGEMGLGQVKKHDIECYMPGRGGYGETHSCSSFGDFQARRSRIRYRARSGKNEFPFTLNNTAVASPRLLIAILENFQQEDGSIRIPDVLTGYMGGKKRIGGSP